MREFILFSRLGRTDGSWANLHDAGRLDIFHAILNGSPSPPVHLKIDGRSLFDVRTDMDTWQKIIRKVLEGKDHPGVSVEKESFEVLLKNKALTNPIFVLEERGKNIAESKLPENPVFVLGDHVGLPKKAELFSLRFGEKISLGKTPYLAASCVTVINYLLDRKEMGMRF